MTPPGDTLLDKARAGDPAALGHLLEKHQDRLYRVCLRMLGHRDDAAEAAQQAMLHIVEHLPSYRGDAQLSTWMTRIAMNESLTRLRRRKVRRTVSLDGDNHRSHHDADDQAAALRHRLAETREPQPLERVQTKERLERLELALASLETDFRSVIVLRDIDGLNYRQIAETLEINEGTVKSRLFRARLALRQKMMELEGQTDGVHD